MTEATFTDLRRKDVINIEDGKRLGNIIDLVFESCSGRILGFVVPGERRLFNFKNRQDVFIPYHSICKVGEDVILVDVVYNNNADCCAYTGGPTIK